LRQLKGIRGWLVAGIHSTKKLDNIYIIHDGYGYSYLFDRVQLSVSVVVGIIKLTNKGFMFMKKTKSDPV
jgi:hypothetical protein